MVCRWPWRAAIASKRSGSPGSRVWFTDPALGGLPLAAVGCQNRRPHYGLRRPFYDSSHREFGIEARSADDRGWGGLTNGALVEAATQAGFRCILTRDRLFSQSAARALKRFPEFCVVLVTIPQLRGPEFLKQFRD